MDRYRGHLPVGVGERVLAMVPLGDVVTWIITAHDRTMHHLRNFTSDNYLSS